MRKKSSKKSTKKKQKKSKVLKITLISLVFFTLLFLGILVFFIRLIFDLAQTYTMESLTPKHIFHQTEVIKRLTNLLWRSKPGKVCVLTLSQAEVNALIATISNSDSIGDFLLSAGQIGKAPKKRPYKVIFKDDYFDIKYSYPAEFYTPFGKHINLSLTGKPGIDKNGIQLDIKSAAAGDLSLPPQQVQKVLHSLLRDYEKDKTFKRIHEVIVKAYITPENNLVIYFYPYRIKNCLTEGF